MKRKLKWAVLVLVLVAIVAAIVISARGKGGSGGRITISKETTYITGPLRPDGYVDYLAAVNQRCSEGVTPENNAAVLFWQASGPSEIFSPLREKYFEMLGIPPLPEVGDYLVTFNEFEKSLMAAKRPEAERDKLTGRMPIDRHFSEAAKRPWSREEFPALAEWLAMNEKPSALAVEGCRRSRYFDPLVTSEGRDGMLFAALLPGVQQQREFARLLTLRAMLRLKDGRVEEAWDDLLKRHRLARLVGQGPSVIHLLLGFGIDCFGDEALLQHPSLTAAQIAKMRVDLEQLPPMPKMADKIDQFGRLSYLDAMCGVSRRGVDALCSSVASSIEPASLTLDSMAFRAINWDLVLRMGNSWYDRIADACAKPTLAERNKALKKVDDEIDELARHRRGWGTTIVSLLINPRRTCSETVSNVLAGLFIGAQRSTIEAEERYLMQFEVTKLAFALAAYRVDHGAYPAKLADLTPEYVAKLPVDIFTDADLHYRLEGDGYLLYSVGPNGIDDGGKGREDCKNGETWDDLAVHIPATQPAPAER